MITLEQTGEFAAWLVALGDHKAKARIVARIEAAKLGNFGDCDSVGDGVSEMRIDFGPGYRVYFMREGRVIYLLLCGGDKSSQKKDIRRARRMAKVHEAAKNSERAAIGASKSAPKPTGTPAKRKANTRKG